jgi:hypothetical protein
MQPSSRTVRCLGSTNTSLAGSRCSSLGPARNMRRRSPFGFSSRASANTKASPSLRTITATSPSSVTAKFSTTAVPTFVQPMIPKRVAIDRSTTRFNECWRGIDFNEPTTTPSRRGESSDRASTTERRKDSGMIITLSIVIPGTLLLALTIDLAMLVTGINSNTRP